MTRLFHISDLHFGLEDRAALDWFRECVRREQPDAVLITGDLTMRARSHEFAAACDWIEALDVPVTVEVGNHDLPYFNPLARFFWPYRRIRRIERLVERELVERRDAPTDRRGVLVVMTDRGRRHVDAAMEALLGAEVLILDGISADDQSALVDSLRALSKDVTGI